MPVTPQFPQKLKKLREEANLTQTQLADKILVSRGAISFYENGDRIPDIEVLARIANEFHVSTDWLLGLSETRSTDAQMRQVCDFTGLSENAIKWLRYFSKSESEADAMVIDFLNGLICDSLIRFRNYGWRYAMAQIQMDKVRGVDLSKDPVPFQHGRFDMYDEKLFAEASKPVGEVSARIEISAHDAKTLFKNRAMDAVSNAAHGALLDFYKKLRVVMDSEPKGGSEHAT